MKSVKFKLILISLISIFLIFASPTHSTYSRTIRNPKRSEKEKFHNLIKRVFTNITVLEDWEKSWVKKQLPIKKPKEKYLTWLKNVRKITNPKNKALKVYYIGIGPFADNVDVISPLLSTNYTQLIAVDKAPLTFKNFEDNIHVSLSKANPKGIKNIKIKKLDPSIKKYGINFTYKGREREVTIYYNKDASNYLPKEVKKGYDTIYSRWMYGKLESKKEIRKDWLKYLNPETGFIITDGEEPYFDKKANGFWDNFTEINLEKFNIENNIIKKDSKAHIFVIKSTP